MKHVVMFSGGLGSWATARRVIDRCGKTGITLLFADTKAEDSDLYRFLDDASEQLDVPITQIADGRTPWQVFKDKRYIGNTRIANCSHLLKQAPCRQWLNDNTDPHDTIIYVGIDWTETHRLPAIVQHWQPWSVIAPLCNPPHCSRDELMWELRFAGLQPPRLYGQGFPHNNCGGACVKAGQTQWLKLLDKDPTRYAQEELEEAKLREYLDKDVSILRDRRNGVTKTLTLTDLRLRHQTQPSDDASDDWGGCGCFTDASD